MQPLAASCLTRLRPRPPTSRLQEYASSPSKAWRSKDCALYLVLAVAVKGRTGERGATTTNKLVNVEDFMGSQVAAGRGARDPVLSLTMKWIDQRLRASGPGAPSLPFFIPL